MDRAASRTLLSLPIILLILLNENFQMPPGVKNIRDKRINESNEVYIWLGLRHTAKEKYALPLKND